MVYETRSGFSPVNINNLELEIDFGQWNFKNLKEKQTEDNWRHTEDHPELTERLGDWKHESSGRAI